MSFFEERYKRLNDHQREAVDAIDGPVMVIAGPGTGKTTILTLRIANILKQTDTPAHGILAITYTDAGVKAMRLKLREIIGNRAHEVAIHTFHSFAASIIAEYPDHFLERGDFKQITGVEQESIINKIISHPDFISLRPMGRPEAYTASIIKSISDCKKEAQTPEMVISFATAEIDRIKNDSGSISTRGASKGQLKADAKEYIEKCQKTIVFAEVYRQYEDDKSASKLRDFDDLIIELLVALKNDQLLLRLIQERFLYLLVDEHQDTNDAQNLIVSLIAEFFDKPNIFIVGDEKQAIYRFQGASVENFLRLQKIWPTMKVISLDTNYRSHQGILDASFAMIENNYEGDEHRDLRIELISGNKEKPMPVDVVTGENTAAIEKYLVDSLKAIMKENEGSVSKADLKIAIITRRNRDLERVIRLLEANNIPVSSERSVDIFHHPVGSIFFSLIDYLADPSENDQLAKTLASGMWGLSFEDSVKMIKALRSGQTSDIEKKIPAIIHLQRKMLNDGSVGFIIHAAEESGFTALVAHDPAYIHVWRGIVALAESLAREGDIHDPIELMKAMLAYRLSAESKTVKVSVGAPDLPIQAMTAHGSKGLEFDHVFIPYANEESWIGKTRGSSFILPQKKVDDHDMRDVRRLFYVALTRAKKHVAILSSLEESDGRSLTPLRFISELDPESIASVILPRIEAQLPEVASVSNSASNSKIGGDHPDKMVDMAKDVLLDNGLSVTALNHFLECPNKFLYESILKLPQALSPAAEKGTAMHEAISNVWKEENRTTEKIQEIISETVAEYLATSFLAVSEKESVKKELSDDAPIIAQALLPHFAVKGPIFTERWVRTVFDGSYTDISGKTQQVIIPIHGKLDAIVESGRDVQVFDYKTSQAMSVNKIKGETKDSDGGYFRQLIFYKLLLADDPLWKNRNIIPALAFISPDDKGRCPIITVPIMPEDTENLKKQIQSLIDSVWSGSIATAKCSDPACPWCGLRQISI